MTHRRTELHRHLELSWRRSSVIEILAGLGVDVSDPEAYRQRLLIDRPLPTLAEVLRRFENWQVLLTRPEWLERLAYEAILDAYDQDGIDLLELRFAPTFIRDANQSLSFDEILAAFDRGRRRAQAERPIQVGWICVLQRTKPVRVGEELMEWAIGCRKTLVGVDLADSEVDHPAESFIPLFQRARAAGLGVTIHAGEAPYPGAAAAVATAVNELGATRIGHGIQAIHDRTVVELLRRERVTLEVCPSSNVLTGSVAAWSDHPLRRLLEAGVRVTLNTDDPSAFATDLNREIEMFKRHLGGTPDEVEQMQRWAREASFIPEGSEHQSSAVHSQ